MQKQIEEEAEKGIELAVVRLSGQSLDFNEDGLDIMFRGLLEQLILDQSFEMSLNRALAIGSARLKTASLKDAVINQSVLNLLVVLRVTDLSISYDTLSLIIASSNEANTVYLREFQYKSIDATKCLYENTTVSIRDLTCNRLSFNLTTAYTHRGVRSFVRKTLDFNLHVIDPFEIFMHYTNEFQQLTQAITFEVTSNLDSVRIDDLQFNDENLPIKIISRVQSPIMLIQSCSSYALVTHVDVSKILINWLESGKNPFFELLIGWRYGQDYSMNVFVKQFQLCMDKFINNSNQMQLCNAFKNNYACLTIPKAINIPSSVGLCQTFEIQFSLTVLKIHENCTELRINILPTREICPLGIFPMICTEPYLINILFLANKLGVHFLPSLEVRCDDNSFIFNSMQKILVV